MHEAFRAPTSVFDAREVSSEADYTWKGPDLAWATELATFQHMIDWTVVSKDFAPAGEYFHALEDSYSHQANPHRRDFGAHYHDRFQSRIGEIAGDVGHANEGHHPDWTFERGRQGLAMLMARDVYENMVDLCKVFYGRCTATPFAQFEGRIARFIDFQPPIFDAMIGPRVVPTVGDYSQKVAVLDGYFRPIVPGEFVLKPYEVEPRQKPFRESIAAKARYEQGVREHYRNWNE